MKHSWSFPVLLAKFQMLLITLMDAGKLEKAARSLQQPNHLCAIGQKQTESPTCWTKQPTEARDLTAFLPFLAATSSQLRTLGSSETSTLINSA
jgi:hypothetical protein